MSTKIDTPGNYRGTISECAFSLTKKSGYPQLVARFQATEKYIDDKDLMVHFEIEEPGWIEWSSYDEYLTGYLVLFKACLSDENNPEECNDENTLLNYEQVKLATGWNGQSFESFDDGSLVGSECQFRVDEETYDGKTGCKVNWIDALDAPLVRELKKLDPAQVKGFSRLINISGGAKKTKAKPAKAAKPKATVKAKKKAAPKAAPKTEAPETTSVTPVEGANEWPPDETTKDEAWAYVAEIQGSISDSDLEGAWIASCAEVGGDKSEDQFSPKDWAKVRDFTVRDWDLEKAAS